jgi:hypothetical protein
MDAPAWALEQAVLHLEYAACLDLGSDVIMAAA